MYRDIVDCATPKMSANTSSMIVLLYISELNPVEGI